jgi:ATP-binding protein involved in chromosome partitioning
MRAPSSFHERTMSSTTPTVITRSDPTQVEIEWSDGARTRYSAAELRRLCPCAQCVNEMTGKRTHDPASVPADLTQAELRMVGNYALSMRFSDGHQTGIFTFPFLREHAPRRAPEPG